MVRNLATSRPVQSEQGDNTNSNNKAMLFPPPVPVTLLQTTLELPLLEAANLLPQPPPPPPTPASKRKTAAGGAKDQPPQQQQHDTPMSFVQKKLKKMNTDMYYRQHKFNLLAEESEGYAKLLAFYMSLLNDDDRGSGSVVATATVDNGADDNHNKHYDHAKRYVRELIGVFDLDPNRVLDLALDVLEWQLNEIVIRKGPSKSSSSSTSASLSFAELDRSNAEGGATTTGATPTEDKDGKDNNDDHWWGLEHLRSAMSIQQHANRSNNSAVIAVHSLLAIIRELDGGDDYSEETGTVAATKTYRGRAVAHLLGFKYRSYRGRAVAKSAAAAAAGALPVGPTTGAQTRCTSALGISTAVETICLSTRGPRQPALHHCACTRLGRTTGATTNSLSANATPCVRLCCCCCCWLLVHGSPTRTSLTPSLGAKAETARGHVLRRRQAEPVPRPIVPGHRRRGKMLKVVAQMGRG